jgi:glutamate-1-semialdehyde 2,1-aminomutase
MRDTRRSEALFQSAVDAIPGGVNSPVRAFGQVGGTPVYFDRASGSRFWDADGNEYIDFCQSWGPLILGHAHPDVVKAVQKSAEDGLSFGACHRKEVELAELVLDAFPEFDRIRMVSSGTEAVMTALRIARGVTGRNVVLKFDGGYHGHFDGMLVKAGSGLATHAIASSGGIPEEIAGTTIVAPLDNENAVEEIFNRRADDIAAVIIEPLPANNGLLIQRPEYLSFLRDITHRHGALLIFDEVISGFRLNPGGYYRSLDIVPDIVTLGKIIGGGMPVGAIVGPAETMEILSPCGAVYQAGTLSGNPVSLSAGIATLKVLKTGEPYAYLEQLGAYFEETLTTDAIPGLQVQREGSILWFYMNDSAFPRSADTISSEAMDRFTAIYGSLLENGLYLPPSSYEVLFLSIAHTRSDIDHLVNSTKEALSDL